VGAVFLIYIVIDGLIAAPANIQIPTVIFILVGIPAALIALAVTKSDFWTSKPIAAATGEGKDR
jgi:hypothetical protein